MANPQVADLFNLDRFMRAQAPVYNEALAELRAGEKRSHWMWFIFPQLRGLGQSAMAWSYGIASLEEASAYLAHPLLGSRLIECTGLVIAHSGRTAHEIFGSPDDLKFRSSMTLFAEAPAASSIFRNAIEKYFGGRFDPLTMDRLGTPDKSPGRSLE